LEALEALDLETTLARAPRFPRPASVPTVAGRVAELSRMLIRLPMPAVLVEKLELPQEASDSDAVGALAANPKGASILAAALKEQTDLPPKQCLAKFRLYFALATWHRLRLCGGSAAAAVEENALAGDLASVHALLTCAREPAGRAALARGALAAVNAACDAECRTFCLGCRHQTMNELLREA
jgi:hypothetical protein